MSKKMGISWKIALLALNIAVLLSSSVAMTIGRSALLSEVDKRSAYDLAMMQIYRICDLDKNGLFTNRELFCVQRVLKILYTGK